MMTWMSSPIDTSGCIGRRHRCGRTMGFELAQHPRGHRARSNKPETVKVAWGLDTKK